MKNLLFKIIGTISVILGTIGIFFPILPTTPFLLLAAWLFLKSSDKLYNWLINHRILGYYIKTYIKYKGVEKRYKILAISMLWITILFSIYIVESFHLRIFLFLIAVGVTVHLLKLRTLTKEEVKELEKIEENDIILKNNIKES